MPTKGKKGTPRKYFKRANKVKGKSVKKPTLKQTRAAKLTAEVLATGKPLNKAEIMRQAGYGPSIAKSPNKVTETDGFKAALEQFLPMEGVVKRHKELMRQNDHLPTAMQAVKEAYNVHGVNSAKGGAEPYAMFLQMVVQKAASQPEEKTVDVEI